MSIKKRLEDEFYDEISELGKTEIGNDKYKANLNGVTQLADRIIELEKLEAEQYAKCANQETENQLKVLQMQDDKRDRIIRNAIEGLKIAGGLGLAAWAFVASMNFEKEGTLTTQGGRKALDQLLKFVKF